MLLVVGVAVRITERDENFLVTVRINAKNLVEFLIADV